MALSIWTCVVPFCRPVLIASTTRAAPTFTVLDLHEPHRDGRANPTLTMIHALADSLGVAVTELFVPASGTAKTSEPAATLPRPSRGRVSR